MLSKYLIPAVALAVAAVALSTPMGDWASSFFSGSGIRWTDAYEAMETVESNLPANPGERDRLLLANARAEDEPPPGMPIGARLHKNGTLVHLRYEVIPNDGDEVDVIEVRALVPPLPYFGAEARDGAFGDLSCPRECSEQWAVTDRLAIVLDRSGKPGLAYEWILRMPVGRTFELGKRSFAVQDLQHDKPYAIPYLRMRVTLLGACHPRVRIGAVTSLEFFPYATIPIPRGFRTRRWVQLDGCPAMAKAVPAVPQQLLKANQARSGEIVRLRSDAYKPYFDLEAVKPVRNGPLGRALLVVDEQWVEQHGHAMLFRMLRACRYDASLDRWTPLPFEAGDYAIALNAGRPGEPGSTTRVAFRFPEEAGLFWAEWTETDREARDQGPVHSALIFAGSKLDCNDAGLREPAAGEITTCVPRSSGAEARVLPAPETGCKP